MVPGVKGIYAISPFATGCDAVSAAAETGASTEKAGGKPFGMDHKNTIGCFSDPVKGKPLPAHVLSSGSEGSGGHAGGRGGRIRGSREWGSITVPAENPLTGKIKHLLNKITLAFCFTIQFDP